MTRTTGTLHYTDRAFSQDAELAMRGDVIRGLIELITNADDAYGDREGDIAVDVRRPLASGEDTVISVSDRARGLSPEEMTQAFSVLGGRTSGFAEGAAVRGLLGRGAKDTACFGKTVFRAIKDGCLSTMTIDRTGTWELDTADATAEDYTGLGLAEGGHGLTATMHVSSTIGVRVPDKSKMLHRLKTHVQLRRLTAARTVTYVDRRGDRPGRSEVVVWEEPRSEVLLEKILRIPGADTDTMLVIRKLAERSDGGISEYSVHGVEVRGVRAAYMNTMFSLSGHGVGLIRGTLTCPHIDRLIREYDEDTVHPPENPMRLVRRDRDGLVEDHPFYRALMQAVIEELKPILDALEPRSAVRGGSRLRQDLNRAARLLSEMMQKDIDDLEGGGELGGLQPTPDSPIVVIPPTLKARVGTTRTLTILIHRSFYRAGAIVASCLHGRAAIPQQPTAAVAHATLPDILVSRMRVTLNQVGSDTVVLEAPSIGTERAVSHLIIHDEDEDEEKEPTELEWKNATMTVTLGKERSLELRAPAAAGPDGTLTVTVDAENACVNVLDKQVTLRLKPAGWLVGKCRIRGEAVGSSTRIRAESGAARADGRITVKKPERELGSTFRFELVDVSEGPTRGRVVVDDEGYVIQVFGRHSGIAPYLGPLDGDAYRDGESPTARAVLAECIASVASDYIVRRDSERDPSAYGDIDMVMQQRSRFIAKYLPCLMQALKVDA